jgi:hypothetical protein
MVLRTTLLTTSTLLGEASKIWEVRRKSIGSPQEVRSNSFLNRYPTRSIAFLFFALLAKLRNQEIAECGEASAPPW